MSHEITRMVIHDENTGVTIIQGRHDDGEFGYTANYPTLVLNGVAVDWTFGFGDLTDNEEYYAIERKLFEATSALEEVTQYIKRVEGVQPKAGIGIHAAPPELRPHIVHAEDPQQEV